MHTGYSHSSAASLFTGQGERKYLNAAECKRFYKALDILTEPTERTFCETIYWTGCRISEALGLDIARVNVEDAYLVFRTLKKHGKDKNRHFRIVPVRKDFAKRLDRFHRVVCTQRDRHADQHRRLWRFGRQRGYRIIKTVMRAAKIFGIRATARGLRHSFGVDNILAGTPLTQLQKWLGHSDLRTTSIYLDVIGIEDRALAKRFWKYRDV